MTASTSGKGTLLNYNIQLFIRHQEKKPQLSTSTVAGFTADLQFNEFHRITQEELKDLIRDLVLPKSKAELLVSRLE